MSDKPWLLVETNQGDITLNEGREQRRVDFFWWNWDIWFDGDDLQRRDMVADYRQMPQPVRQELRAARKAMEPFL